jgi:CheY-like chemotaxis protein
MPEQPKRILLAEDDRFLRKATQAALGRAGFTVLPACDGEEALHLAINGSPDLILLDLIMPKLQGFEVLRWLKEDPNTAEIPVIVLSNLGQEGDVQQAMQGGAVDYLVKSGLSLKELVRRVEQQFAAGVRP